MTTTSFNAITYANKLKEAGMATRVADVQAEEMSNLINNDLVTNLYLSQKLKELELNMIVKVGAMMVIQTGLILTVIGLLFRH